MIWRLARSPECSADIRNAGWATAEAVCMAVHQFATDGSGQLEPVGDVPHLFYLRAPGGFATLRVSEATKTLYVSRIIANNPAPRVMPLLDDPIYDEPSED